MRRRDADVPAAAEAARPRAARARHGRLGRGGHRRVYCPASYLSSDRRSLVDSRAGEEAIRRGLSKRLEQLADERERRERAAAAEDEAFSAEFLFAARKVFMMARGRRRQLPSKPSRRRASERHVTHGSFTHRSTKMTRARSQRKRLPPPSRRTRKLSTSWSTAATRTSSTCWCRLV